MLRADSRSAAFSRGTQVECQLRSFFLLKMIFQRNISQYRHRISIVFADASVTITMVEHNRPVDDFHSVGAKEESHFLLLEASS